MSTITTIPPAASVTSTVTVPNGGYTLGSGLGLSGQTLTAGGYGVTWANVSSPSTMLSTDASNSSLKVNGNADFSGDLTVKGKNLTDALERIEARLKIIPEIKLDPELEKKYEELAELGKRYQELQAEIKEKEKVWAILNK